MRLKVIWRRWFPGVGTSLPEAADAAATPLPLEQRKLFETQLGYQFHDRSLLDNALLHRSHSHVTGASPGTSNERLEFLGDAVLGLVVNEYLYRAYPQQSEGDLTKMKSLLVCGSRLAEVATTLGLGAYVQMSRAEAATGGRHRASILADTTEAVIGAVFLDGGLPAAAGVIRRWLLDSCDEVLSHRGLENYKSRLQEMVQARYKSPPRYRVLAAEGPDHERVFRVCVTFNGQDLGRGEGPNKKAAEQLAARDALDRIASDPGLLADQP
jgi:ribonuclease III